MDTSLRPGFGVMTEMKHQVTPFDSAIMSYAARHGGKMSSLPGSKLLRHTFAQSKRPLRMSEVAPVRELSREIKMMSLNPSIYGNCCGVLGSS
jgi:hypothetical protein